MSSWRQYGGTNKLNKTNNLNVNHLSSDTMTIRDAYTGNFDICGNLTVDKNINIKNNLQVDGNIHVSNNVVIDDKLTVYTLQILVEEFRLQTALLKGNITVQGESNLYNTVYLDPLKNEFIKGNNGNIGMNTINPQATLDIYDIMIIRVL